jgi:hypothetical protein
MMQQLGRPERRRVVKLNAKLFKRLDPIAIEWLNERLTHADAQLKTTDELVQEFLDTLNKDKVHV